MKKHIIIYMLATGMLTGCGIYTKYEKQSDVPSDLYGDTGTTTVAEDTTGLAKVSWRKMFNDPQLHVLIEEALRNNTDLGVAHLRIDEAQATLTSAKLALLPSFALSPQGSVSSFDGGKASQTYSLPLTASWELDVFGKMRNARMQAKALYAQSQDYEQAVRAQLIASVANTYYTLLMLDEQMRISVETRESWKETVEATKALAAAGLANEVAVSQMEAAMAAIGVSIYELEEQINKTENSMAQLLSVTPRHFERGNLAQQATAISSQQYTFRLDIPITILANRPDVRAAERQMEQAFYVVNQARSAFYPQIVLTGSAGWTNAAGIFIQNPAKFLAQAVGSLTQPLFARGQLAGQLKISKAQQEEAALSFRQALLNAGIEVNDALTQWQTACKKTEAYGSQVAALQKAYDDSKLLMEHGTTTYLDVLTAQQSLLGAQLSQTANCFAELQGIVSLYNALGGGTIGD